jgi:DNA-binding NarL/FixJ family response regulator
VIRVAIADDQEMVRDGFAMILAAQDDIEVVGVAADGAQAIALARETTPDVVLMDVRMPGMDGLEATRRLLRNSTDGTPRVLILTTFDLDEYIYEALKAGASGFLLKDAPRAQLIAGVRTVAAGDSLLAPSITRRLIEEFVRSRPRGTTPPPEVARLSEREREVLRLVARGLSNAEVGQELFVSEATVKTHVAHVLQKLGLRDRVQAVVLAYESGLITPGAED